MDFVNLIEKLGWPAAILFFVGLGLWKILIWVGNKVVLPVSTAHIELVESAKKTNETNAKTLDTMTSILTNGNEKLQKLNEKMDVVAEKRLDRVESKLDQLLQKKIDKIDEKVDNLMVKPIEKVLEKVETLVQKTNG